MAISCEIPSTAPLEHFHEYHIITSDLFFSQVMYVASSVLLLVALSTTSLANVQFARTCPDLCTCTGTSAKCRLVTDDTLEAVLKQLPNDLTKL